MNVKKMGTIMRVILVLACASAVWAVQNDKYEMPLEQQQAIEKAILKANSEMIKAAETLNAEALYDYVLKSDKGPIIMDGVLFRTRQEALNVSKQGFEGLKSYCVKFNQQHVTVISATVALLTAQGTCSVMTKDEQQFDYTFAETIVFILKEGQWKILHAHKSSPKTF